MKSEVRKWIFTDFIILTLVLRFNLPHLKIMMRKISSSFSSSLTFDENVYWQAGILFTFIFLPRNLSLTSTLIGFFGPTTTTTKTLFEKEEEEEECTHFVCHSLHSWCWFQNFFYVTTWNAIKSPVLETFCVSI